MKLGHKIKNTSKCPKFELKVRTGYAQFGTKSAKEIKTTELRQQFSGSYKKECILS